MNLEEKLSMAVGSRTDCCGLRRHALIAGGAGHEQFEAFIRTPPPPRCTLARAPYLTPILAMNRASTLFKIFKFARMYPL